MPLMLFSRLMIIAIRNSRFILRLYSLPGRADACVSGHRLARRRIAEDFASTGDAYDFSGGMRIFIFADMMTMIFLFLLRLLQLAAATRRFSAVRERLPNMRAMMISGC